MNAQIEGKTFIITGASGGIGQAMCSAFLAEGARIVAHYHSNSTAIDSLMKDQPDHVLGVQADLRVESEVESMIQRAIDYFTVIDGIVVNAGVSVMEGVDIVDMSLAQWRSTHAADLDSAFLTCRSYLKHVRERGLGEPSIVLIGSTAALFGEAGNADYASAKAAMTHGMTLSLKNEIVRIAPHGRVNCVCPGWVATPMAAAVAADPAVMKGVCATRAHNDIAKPEDIAHTSVFLSSSKLARHITGAIIPVHGGMEGRLLRKP